jgi:IS4 transposase
MLNIRGYEMDITTFSKANRVRDTQVFEKLIERAKAYLSKGEQSNELVLFPIDSTIVTLTSKLLWEQGYHQVKLFAGLNSATSEPGGISIHFGQGHDSKYGDETINATPQGAVGVMDRGFASLARIKKLQSKKDHYFVLRIKNDTKLEMSDKEGHFFIGAERLKARVVTFCDIETQTEFRLATNLPEEGEAGVRNEEIGQIYEKRWQVELLWKFLKMHLKLSNLITKNINGIAIQIYASILGYIILQLVDIPKKFGAKALDKLRYLQAFMSEKISYVHWLEELVFRH